MDKQAFDPVEERLSSILPRLARRGPPGGLHEGVDLGDHMLGKVSRDRE
jgi:hypothetical protein